MLDCALSSEWTTTTLVPETILVGTWATIWVADVFSNCSGTSLNVTQEPPSTVGGGTVRRGRGGGQGASVDVDESSRLDVLGAIVRIHDAPDPGSNDRRRRAVGSQRNHRQAGDRDHIGDVVGVDHHLARRDVVARGAEQGEARILGRHCKLLDRSALEVHQVEQRPRIVGRHSGDGRFYRGGQPHIGARGDGDTSPRCCVRCRHRKAR